MKLFKFEVINNIYACSVCPNFEIEFVSENGKNVVGRFPDFVKRTLDNSPSGLFGNSKEK